MVPRTQATIDTITSERARFEQFCRSLNAAELARPVPGSTWQVKDFISHLATIDGPIARWFGSLGTEPARGPQATVPRRGMSIGTTTVKSKSGGA